MKRSLTYINRDKAFRKGNFKSILAFILFVTIVVVSSISCTKLEEEPESFISENNYYKTRQDAEASVNSIYYALNGPNGTQVPYNVLFVTGMDFMSDDVLMSLGATNPDVKVQSTLDHTPAALRIKEIWQQHYVAINRANIAIDRIPTIPATSTTDSVVLKRLVLEAKFLRGLYYFNLVRLFGGVPIVLHETTTLTKEALQVPRATADEVYAQIIQDFTDAEALPWFYLPGDANAGRANAAAAKAYLAQVYLTRANINEENRAANVASIAKRDEYLSNAITKSNEIINNSVQYYGLFANYADVFKKSSKNGIEHLFSAQFKSNANKHGNSYAQRNAALGIKDKNGVTVVNGTLGDAATQDLLNKLNQRAYDKRFPVTVTSSYTVNGTTYTIDKAQNAGFSQVINKYYDPDVPSNLIESGINVPLIKYSTVLYINAEANNELYGPNNEAIINYNKLRNRNGLGEISLGLTKDQFRDSLYLDIRIEDTHEYKRWFDLVREIDKDGNHILVKTLKPLKPAASDKHYLYPIPQTEIDVNPKLVQNPGW